MVNFCKQRYRYIDRESGKAGKGRGDESDDEEEGGNEKKEKTREIVYLRIERNVRCASSVAYSVTSDASWCRDVPVCFLQWNAMSRKSSRRSGDRSGTT